jgi:hypothetical protein
MKFTPVNNLQTQIDKRNKLQDLMSHEQMLNHMAIQENGSAGVSPSMAASHSLLNDSSLNNRYQA